MNTIWKKIISFYKKLGFVQGIVFTICFTSAISIATVTIPGLFTFTPGTPISSSQINSNFDKLASLIDNTRSQNYIGTWSVTLNSPDLDVMTPVAGDYYIASNAGTHTFTNGETLTFAVGDWSIYNGISWEKIHITAGSSSWTTSGPNLYYNAGNIGIGTITPGSALDVKGVLRLSGSSSGFVGLTSAPTAGSTVYTLPMADGLSGQVLSTNGGATLGWTTPAAGGTGTVTNVTTSLPLSVSSGSTTPILSITQANTSSNGYISSIDWNTFNGKQSSIIAGTISQYYRGDKSWQTLDTNAVLESTNLYFTVPRTLGAPLMGFNPASSPITSTDTIINAFGKTQGQINSLSATSANYLIKNSIDTVTGTINVGATGLLQLTYAPIGINDAVNKQYVDSFGQWTISGPNVSRTTGNVGIGTSSPAYQLELSTDSAAKPGSSTWTIASDVRLKDIRAPFIRGLEALERIQPIYFRYKEGNPLDLPSDKEYVGIKAQDVEKAVPEAVSVDERGYLHVTTDAIIWTMFNSVKELFHRFTSDSSAIHNEIAMLKSENQMLKNYLCKKDKDASFCH